MFRFLRLWLGAILRFFRSPQELLAKNLALRHVSMLKRRNRRPKLSVCDKFFRILARWFWSDWRRSPFAVAPEAVVGWHRAGFRLYWSMIQDPQAGG